MIVEEALDWARTRLQDTSEATLAAKMLLAHVLGCSATDLFVFPERTLAAGTAVVRLDQPLGRPTFYLLEPRSDDGLASWGLLDRALQADDDVYPIVRAMSGDF